MSLFIIYNKFRYQWTKIPFYFMGLVIGVFIYFYRIILHQGFKCGNRVQYRNTKDLNVFNQSKRLS